MGGGYQAVPFGADGAPLGEIWVRSLQQSGAWDRVPRGGYVAGEILAPTYSHSDGHLWIIQKVVADGRNEHRELVRVDPDIGKPDVLGCWPVQHSQQCWLQTDRDGSMLLFVSNGALNTHMVMRIRVQDRTLAIVGGRDGQGAIAHAPVVDMAGYWLFTHSATEGCATLTHDLSDGHFAFGMMGDVWSGPRLGTKEGVIAGSIGTTSLSVMTAPFETDPAKLKPRRLRSDLWKLTPFGFGVGCGYAGRQVYTPVGDGEWSADLYVIRLSDGVAWLISPGTPKTGMSFSHSVLGFTCDEVFATAQFPDDTISIVRIRLDTLGPGIAPD